jgi:hypothetical protein
VGLGAVSCGASIQALYESDVRFEHCMALDARPDVKPTLRRGCWDEWVKFYTFGQTRDRIEHAELRERQLSQTSDFDEGDWQTSKPSGASAAPDPTSPFAPPPMMLVADAGSDARAPDAPPDAAADRPPPGADCTADCEQSWSLCRQECKAAPCEKACTTKYKRCMKRCF